VSLEILEDRTAPSATPVTGYDVTVGEFLLDPVHSTAEIAADVSAQLIRSGQLIGLPMLRSDFGSITGKGIGVAVIDTGIDTTHPALRVAGGVDIVQGDGNPDDDNGHGTHVAGIIGSQNGTYTGVAPGVNLYAVKVLNSAGGGSWSNIARGLDWVIANAEALNIRVVNMSLGDGGNYAENGGFAGAFYGIHSRIGQLEGMGVTVVAAAGHSDASYDPAMGSNDPGSASTFSVGAVWSARCQDDEPFFWSTGATDITTAADRVVSFSRATPPTPAASWLPRAIITSTIPPEFDSDGTVDGFIAAQGTSMASPHVAGVVALMQDAASEFLGHYLTPSEGSRSSATAP
jgi:subtilisin family serine protease